jgi:hypothetical protein
MRTQFGCLPKSPLEPKAFFGSDQTVFIGAHVPFSLDRIFFARCEAFVRTRAAEDADQRHRNYGR